MALLNVETRDNVVHLSPATIIDDSTYIRLTVGTYMEDASMESMKETVDRLLNYFIDLINAKGIPEIWKVDGEVRNDVLNERATNYIHNSIRFHNTQH